MSGNRELPAVDAVIHDQIRGAVSTSYGKHESLSGAPKTMDGEFEPVTDIV